MTDMKESCGYTKSKIYFVRHGQCKWYEENKFTGWYDSPLSDGGMEEAASAGEILKNLGVKFDEAHISVLTRSIQGMDIILEKIGQKHIPVYKSWRLNDLHVGDLTGKNKLEISAKHGENQVFVWRRGYEVPPPPMESDHPYYNDIMDDPRYAEEPSKDKLPLTESLQLLMERSLPYWENNIVPKLRDGKTILMVTHGHTLRGFVKYLDNVGNERISKLSLPNGIPFCYEFDKNLYPIVSLKFLGSSSITDMVVRRISAHGYFKTKSTVKGLKSLT